MTVIELLVALPTLAVVAIVLAVAVAMNVDRRRRDRLGDLEARRRVRQDHGEAMCATNARPLASIEVSTREAPRSAENARGA